MCIPVVQFGETVIAEHPKFKFVYLPGEVVKYWNNPSKLMVRFYDYAEGFPPKQRVYRISMAKFKQDIHSMIALERKFLGLKVFGYNNLAKKFQWGVIKNRLHLNRQFSVLWSDGSEAIQNAYGLFVSRDGDS